MLLGSKRTLIQVLCLPYSSKKFTSLILRAPSKIKKTCEYPSFYLLKNCYLVFFSNRGLQHWASHAVLTSYPWHPCSWKHCLVFPEPGHRAGCMLWSQRVPLWWRDGWVIGVARVVETVLFSKTYTCVSSWFHGSYIPLQYLCTCDYRLWVFRGGSKFTMSFEW